MGQQAIQVSLTSVWVLFAGPIAGAITPEWWYGLGAALAGLLFVVALLFLPETKYDRSLSSYQEDTSSGDDGRKDSVGDVQKHDRDGICLERPPLDTTRYAPRTFKSDLRLWVGKPEWSKAWEVLRVSYFVLASAIRTDDTSKLSSYFCFPMFSGLFFSTVSRSV